MAWSKAKMAIITGAGILLAASATVVTVQHIKHAENNDDQVENSWRVAEINSAMLDRLAPEVKILPTKFPSLEAIVRTSANGDKFIGISVQPDTIARIAYSNTPPNRVIYPNTSSKEKYDFISTATDSAEALRQEVKNNIGLIGHWEIKNMDVLLLKVQDPNSAGLQPPSGGTYFASENQIKLNNQPLSKLAYFLEGKLDNPIVDQTGLSQHFNVEVNWDERGEDDPKHDALKQALLDQLGLELVPTNMPLEMLVLESAKK